MTHIHQLLFKQILESGIVFDHEGIGENEMVRDSAAFLVYVQQQKPYITSAQHNIRLTHIRKLNPRFVHPDPQGYKNEDYREEWQYPKVTFLHGISFFGGLIEQRKNRLVLTEKGEQFLLLPAGQQFGQILRYWFIDTDWEYLDWQKIWMPKEFIDQPLSRLIQFFSWQLLKNCRNHTDSNMTLPELFAGISLSKTDEGFRAYLTRSIQRIFMLPLLWAGIAETKKSRTAAQFPFRITPFGIFVIDSIETAMNKAQRH